MQNRIAIIGAGNMGGAFYRGLVEFYSTDTLSICDTNAEKLAALGALHASTDCNTVLRDADIVIFAIKPQSFQSCREAITVDLRDKFIISIMAGVTLRQLRESTQATKIVRAMPNLGAQVRRGFTGWIALPGCSVDETRTVQQIFQAVGVEMQLPSEEMLDALACITGCGPAYFFLLCELLADKAVEFGFPPEDAQRMSEEVLLASAGLLETGERSAKEWREAVTSKGGVTEAALKVLHEEGLGAIFSRALKRAKERLHELSR